MPPSKEQRTTRQSRPRPGARTDAASCSWLVTSSYGLTRPGRFPADRATLSLLSDQWVHASPGSWITGAVESDLRKSPDSGGAALASSGYLRSTSAARVCLSTLRLCDVSGYEYPDSTPRHTYFGPDTSVRLLNGFLGCPEIRRPVVRLVAREMSAALGCSRGSSDGSSAQRHTAAPLDGLGGRQGRARGRCATSSSAGGESPAVFAWFGDESAPAVVETVGAFFSGRAVPTPGGPQRGATTPSPDPTGVGADLERVTASTQLGRRAASFSYEVMR